MSQLSNLLNKAAGAVIGLAVAASALDSCIYDGNSFINHNLILILILILYIL